MKISEVIALAEQESAILYVENQTLKCKPGPKGLSDSLIEGIKSNKDALLAMLSQTHSQVGIAADKDELSSVSFAQARMFVEHQLAAPNALNIAVSVKVEGQLDTFDFTKAVEGVCQRHKSLTQGFSITERGVQAKEIKAKPALKVMVAESVSSVELAKTVTDFESADFDLQHDVKLRALLVKYPNYSKIVLVTHHIAVDFQSLQLIATQLLEETLNPRNHIPANEYWYGDFAHNQRQQMAQSNDGVDFWRTYLKGSPSTHSLPKSSLSKSEKPSSELLSWQIEQHKLDALSSFCSSNKVSKFAVLKSLWGLITCLYSHTKDTVIGTPVSGRFHQLDETVVGPYLNSLPLRSTLIAEESLTQYILRQADEIKACLDNQYVPFEKIIECAEQQRSSEDNPLFQLFFTHREMQPNWLEVNGVCCEVEQQNSLVRTFDMELASKQTESGLTIELLYNSACFEPHLPQAMLASFGFLVAELAAHQPLKVSELPLGHKDTSLTGKQSTSASMSSLFEQIASHSKVDENAIAIEETNGQSMTYGELRNAVLSVSKYVRHCVSGETVGVMLNRDITLLPVLLGVWHAGKAYVPIDHAYPQKRISYILEDAAIVDVFTNIDMPLPEQSSLTRHLPAQAMSTIADDSALTLSTPDEQLAYMIYTSGTTGLPKGVKIPHSAVTNFLCAMQEKLQLESNSQLLAITSISFDISVLELMLPLYSGAKVVLAKEGESKNPSVLAEMMQSLGVTHLQATPSSWRLLQRFGGLENCDDITALSGGEALPKDLATWLVKTFGSVWNLYGPTEATVWASMSRLTSTSKPVSIGTPILNTQMTVVSPFGQPLPAGAIGELAISGKGLALGYHNRPELNQDKFIEIAGTRSYLTGDLVRIDNNGDLICLGREDHQVKVNGHRIELAEIESQSRLVDGVLDAVVDAQWVDHRQQLVAFIVSNGSEIELQKKLTEHYKVTLPVFMQPTEISFIPAIPYTPNGKIDLKQLPQVGKNIERSGLDNLIQPTSSSNAEIYVQQLFSKLLGKDVDSDADFFMQGGNSLSAIHLLNNVNQHFHTNLSLGAFFAEASIAGIVKRLGEQADTERKIDLAPTLANYPLSSVQQRLWMTAMAGNEQALLMRFSYVLDHTPASERLTSAAEQLVTRHEILRTTYAKQQGSPVQIIHAHMQPEVNFLTTQFNTAADAEEELAELAAQPFDLSSDCAVRIHVALLEDGAVLDINVCHLASDAWSTEQLVDELLQLYNKEQVLPKTQYAYKDFAYWEQQALNAGEFEQEQVYWQEQLAHVPAYPSSIGNLQYQSFTGQGRRVRHVLGASAYQAMQKVKLDSGLTEFGVGMSTFGVLLNALTGEEKIAVVTPINNRVNADFEQVIGCFVNTLPIVIEQQSELQTTAYLASMKHTIHSAITNGLLPFEQMVNRANSQKESRLAPYSTFVFSAQSHDQERSKFAKDVARVGTQALIKLHLDVTPSSVELLWDIDEAVFTKETLHLLTSLFEHSLLALAEPDAETISSLIDSVFGKMNQQGTKPLQLNNKQTLNTELLSVASKSPQQIAVICSDKSYTYETLIKKAKQIAAYLNDYCDIKEGDVVATIQSRHANMVVSAVGILLSGATYLPIDPNQDEAKKQYMLSHANATCLITDNVEFATDICTKVVTFGEASKYQPSAKWAPAEVTVNSTAALLFTSGTTANSKGVLLSHGGLLHTMKIQGQDVLRISKTDNTLHFASASFDAYTQEWILPLLCGASICIANDEIRKDPYALAKFIDEHQVSLIGMTPSTLACQQFNVCRSLKKVMVFGESMSNGLLQKISQFAQVYNAYGPTECSICISVSELDGSDSIHIGTPFPGVGFSVQTPTGTNCPVGTPGELVLMGDMVALAYLIGTTDDSARQRIGTRGGTRFFRTGDRVVVNSDGQLVYLGRLSGEVKILGQRVNLSELQIELASTISDGEVAVAFDSNIEKVRIFTTSQASNAVSLLSSQPLLANLPIAIQHVYALPQTVNGKVDHKALLALPWSEIDIIEAPINELETQLLKLWQELLGEVAKGTNQNFYHLGGNSILAVKLAYRCEQEFAIEIDMQALIGLSTVQEQAAWISERNVLQTQDQDLEEFEL